MGKDDEESTDNDLELYTVCSKPKIQTHKRVKSNTKSVLFNILPFSSHLACPNVDNISLFGPVLMLNKSQPVNKPRRNITLYDALSRAALELPI
jgi:hypothetical protein